MTPAARKSKSPAEEKEQAAQEAAQEGQVDLAEGAPETESPEAPASPPAGRVEGPSVDATVEDVEGRVADVAEAQAQDKVTARPKSKAAGEREEAAAQEAALRDSGLGSPMTERPWVFAPPPGA